MKLDIKEKITVPEGVHVTYIDNLITVKGSSEVKRTAILPRISIKQEAHEVIIETKNGTKTQKTLINTYKAHIKNMIKGVTEGHNYKLKICSGHFPMSVGVKGKNFEIKNFIGEKVPRVIEIPEDVKIKVEGELITLDGNSKEKVGMIAGQIEQLTRRSGFDKRIFQDGIYIIEKDGKKL